MKGLGTDIIEIKRIETLISRYGKKFLDRIFTAKEQAYCLTHKEFSRHFAGRFAAKEAIVKALGVGLTQGISWADMEILPDEKGKPCCHCSPLLKELFDHPRLHISISHCRDYATATAIWD